MRRPITRILVRGVNWLGDSIMTIPALRYLRRCFPQARLTLLVRPSVADVFRQLECLDEVMARPLESVGDILRVSREVRSRRMDAAIVFPNAFGAAFLMAAAGIPLRIGYATGGRRWLLTHPLGVPARLAGQHQVYFYLHLVAEAVRVVSGESPPPASPPDLHLTVSVDAQRQMRERLAAAGIDARKKLVVLNPGALNSRAKQWLPERFAAVGEALLRRGDTAVILIGTADERPLAERVRQQMTAEPLVLAGQTTVAEVMALLACAHLLISNDTGAAHLGAALGLPSVVIFGPTEDFTTRPFSPQAHVVKHPVACSPCMLRDCPIDHRCMRGVEVRDVLGPAEEILDRATAARGMNVSVS